jgi:glyoxylase-like metal-dependent hydrolase (beta-lactamase superfamily II)
LVAHWHQIVEGYVHDGGQRVASSVVYVKDQDHHIIIDPGMVANQSAILNPLAKLGISPDQITDVVISHHHPDHTMNVGLFGNARVHSATSIYFGENWDDAVPNRDISPGVRMIATPGHQPEDISVVIDGVDSNGNSGIVIYTHEWWMESGPEIDPYAADQNQLAESRKIILDLKPMKIIPAHGPAFTVEAKM